MKKKFVLLFTLTILFTLVGCSNQKEEKKEEKKMPVEEIELLGKKVKVVDYTKETDEQGNVHLQLELENGMSITYDEKEAMKEKRKKEAFTRSDLKETTFYANGKIENLEFLEQFISGEIDTIQVNKYETEDGLVIHRMSKLDEGVFLELDTTEDNSEDATKMTLNYDCSEVIFDEERKKYLVLKCGGFGFNFPLGEVK